MRYTDKVEAISQLNTHRTLRYAVGTILCWLLVVYALGAKLALYHPHQPGAKLVAATKAWQDHDAPVAALGVEMASAVAAIPQVNVGALLMALTLAVVWLVPVDRSVPAVVRGFSIELSVRPPPVA